ALGDRDELRGLGRRRRGKVAEDHPDAGGLGGGDRGIAPLLLLALLRLLHLALDQRLEGAGGRGTPFRLLGLGLDAGGLAGLRRRSLRFGGRRGGGGRLRLAGDRRRRGELLEELGERGDGDP